MDGWTVRSGPNQEQQRRHIHIPAQNEYPLRVTFKRLILPDFPRVGRRGYDIVPAGAQISGENSRLVQRVLCVLRRAKRLVLALVERDRRPDTRRGRDEVVEEEGAVSRAGYVARQ